MSSDQQPTVGSTRKAEDNLAISVIIPTKNEEDGIQECICRAKEAFRELGVEGEIIVSDASTDRTPDIARELGATVVHPDKSGYGYAYLYAFEQAKGDIIVMGDGDTTYDFSDIPKLVARIEDGADIVMGSRFEGTIESGAMPLLHRYVGNPLLTRFLNVFYGSNVTDAHSGFRVIRREVLAELEPNREGMEFASEMIMRAKRAGLTIEEVPITYHPRLGEATLDSFSDGWRHLKFMLVNAPGDLFLIPGIVVFSIGLIVMGVVLFDLRPFGQNLGSNTMTVGALCSLLGSQVTALGFASGIVSDPIKEPWPWLHRRVVSWFSSERGIIVGLLLGAVGVAVAVSLLYRWFASGYVLVPDPSTGIFALTLIVVGAQAIFHSLFIDLINEKSNP